MGETHHQSVAVLLPSSSVAIFSRDKETLESGFALAEDWRFARVSLVVEEGDVSSAIEMFKDVPSPNLIIVQTDDIDDGLTDRLTSLAEHCEEGTTAIVIGPVNDVNLYRTLIDMGVSDYLVRPVSGPVLADVISKTLIDRLGVTDSRLIAFIGAKGGVGTSAIAQAAAWGASEVLGQKTVLLDVSGGWSALPVGMGFEPSTTLSEAAKAASNNDEDSLKRMLFTVSEKLRVLASGGDIMLEEMITVEQLEMLIDILMVKYPVVILDLSGAPAEYMNMAMTKAGQIQVVATPNLVPLRLARSLIHEIRELRGGKDGGIELLLNMQGREAGQELSKADAEKALEVSVCASIPYAPKVFMSAESEGKSVLDVKEGRAFVETHLLPALQKAVGGQAPVSSEAGADKPGLLSGLLGRAKSS